jgi:hypothetical protein
VRAIGFAFSVIGVVVAATAEAQSAPRWSLREVASIGGAEAQDARYVFDGVTESGIAGRTDGSVLVLDTQGKRVLEYDAAGRHVRTWGRAGEGPGELKFPSVIDVGAGDSLWIYDSALRRFTVFGRADGAPRTARAAVGTFGRLRAAGGAIVQALSAVAPQGVSGVGSMTPTCTHLARFSGDATLRDTIWSGPIPARVLATVRDGNNTLSTHATEQYALTTHWDQLSDGTLAVADTSAYLLRLVSRDGRVVRTLGTGEAARPVTAADRERALGRLRAAQRRPSESLSSPAMQAALREKQLEQTPFARVVPRISGLLVDQQDRIWVGVWGENEDVERMDVYSATGQLVAVVTDPPAFPAAVYGRGLVAFLDRDEFDAQRVRIMQVLAR